MSDRELFVCAICGGVFPFGDEAESRREAEANGIDFDTAAAVCNDCYRVTPWGDAPDESEVLRRFAHGRTIVWNSHPEGETSS